MKAEVGNLIGLIVLTVGAAIVMITFGIGNGLGGFSAPRKREVALAALPKIPVSVLRVEPKPIEIIDRYTGMLRPFERFALAFDVSGRIQSLGTNDRGEPLDIGDRVKAGQELAKLDDRYFLAQLKEAKARLELAQANMNRANELRGRNKQAMTDAEFQDRVTQLELAEAGLATAEKRVEDAVLLAPVDGTISKRMLKAGESANLHQPVFELLQNDRVLLVLGVPESRVSPIEVGEPVYVDMQARNQFGEAYPPLKAQVFRVGEAADDKTGLFEVEVAIPNPDDRLRPGMIATARIVTSVVEGFVLPGVSAVHQEGATALYAIDAEHKARKFNLTRWIEQGPEIVVPEIPPEFRTVVVRGQHRLIEGREVEIADAEGGEVVGLHADVTLPGASVGAKP